MKDINPTDWQKQLEPILKLLDKVDKYVLDGGYGTDVPSRELALLKVGRIISEARKAEREKILLVVQYAVEDEETIQRIKNGIEALEDSQPEGKSGQL